MTIAGPKTIYEAQKKVVLDEVRRVERVIEELMTRQDLDLGKPIGLDVGLAPEVPEHLLEHVVKALGESLNEAGWSAKATLAGRTLSLQLSAPKGK